MFLLILLWYGAAKAEASEQIGVAVGPFERDALVSCYGYGDGFAGQLMASGAPFHPEAPVVAHKSLPFGTPVVFRHGGAEVVGIVQDRGPFVGDREFDLSCGLMRQLGLPPGVYVLGVS